MKYTPALITVLLLSAAQAFSPAQARGQLLEVNQTVFGMDCAPCAYALEKRLKKIERVTKARVSLNEGLASTELAKESRIRLSTIREAVRESGFSAEHAVIRAAGTLKQESGRWIFVLPGGAFFVLEGSNTAEGAYPDLKPGRAVVTGSVGKGEPGEGGSYELKLLAVAGS